MKKTKKLALCTVLLLAAFACKKSSSGSSTITNGTTVINGTTTSFSSYGYAILGDTGSADSLLQVTNTNKPVGDTGANVQFVQVTSPKTIALGTYTGSSTLVSVSFHQSYSYSSTGDASDSVTITSLNSSYVSGTYKVTVDTSATYIAADTIVIRGTFGASIF